MRYLDAHHYLTVARDADLDADGLTDCCSMPTYSSPLRCRGCGERIGAN